MRDQGLGQVEGLDGISLRASGGDQRLGLGSKKAERLRGFSGFRLQGLG